MSDHEMSDEEIGGQESIDDILASSDEARRSLFDIELELQKQLDEIRFRAFQEDRPLTDEEKALRKQLRASQSEIRDAHVELAYVTAARLDSSEEVAVLKQRIVDVNEALQDDISELKKIEALAEKAARVSDTIAKVTEKVAKKAADLLA